MPTQQESAMTASATTKAKSIHAAIHGAIFGRIDAAAHRISNAGCSIADVHELSQGFALAAAPLGGGGVLAMQVLGAQPASRRRSYN
jgi:hypothetical protein